MLSSDEQVGSPVGDRAGRVPGRPAWHSATVSANHTPDGSLACVSATTTAEVPDVDDAPAPPRRGMSRLRRLVVGIAVVVALALVATTVFGVVTVRRPLPTWDGELSVPGLEGEVEVVRDAQGVPHVYAGSAHDLFAAQGYLHAQDRFFEMDYRRHVTAGRLAELVGDVPEAIEADMVIRTLGWRRVAEQEWHLLAPETRAYLQAYAEGVNAYVDSRDPEELALEYTVLGLTVDLAEPEPWDPIDSLAWLKAMAWDMRSNYQVELERALAYSTLEDVALVEELFPPYSDAGNEPILANADRTDAAAGSGGRTAAQVSPEYAAPAVGGALDAARRALDAVPVLVGRGEGTGSNSWVVSGEHTASGAPILANDPHLTLGAPSIWSQVGLHCATVDDSCPFDVAGFSFAGFPGVVIGHNDRLAWGLTNMYADVTDFFVERVRDDTWLADRSAERWEPMDVRTETIRVAGGRPIDIEVRSTAHGPIVSGVLDLDDVVDSPTEAGTAFGEYAVSLGWTALEPGRTADAVFAMNLAQDADDVRAAAELFEVPNQNIVFATTDGHIGYQAPGRVPIRADVDGPVPSDGTWPRPGWDPRYDWQGYVDPDDMPRALDPASGYVVAANQAVLSPESEPFLGRDFDYGYRAERIRTLLDEQIATGRPFTVADMNRIQNDEWSPFAEVLLPVLLEVDVPNDYDAAGQELLADWDGRMDADSHAAAYFAAVWRNLLKDTFWDDLPESMRPSGNSRWLVVMQHLLERPEDPLWDDRSTLNVLESRDEILTQALVSARRDLTVELSKEPEDWSWGALHTLELAHPVLGGEDVPGLVRDYVNPRAVPMGGGSSIVNATGWDAGSGSFAVRTGPSMRMVVDLGDLDASTWVTVTGVSGHPASRHYSDQLEAWASGTTFAWPFSREAVGEAARTRATLVP
ncbi:peptidase S45 penicillin amidase [Isoptericola variabilis 225]|uniref:Peptidase S45 penicillin amidase n=2 Tax=Isoptericola TaxID=254250 RepID=F6FSS8_ISOV2|nr:peptidase S45 penicillin amidase [Isoptericola variabilis 225]